MTEYSFTLTYRLADDDCDPDALVERLGEAGCTDALLGIGTTGRLALDFVRNRETAELALRSALQDVKAAVPTATLVEASPDFVGLTDVADIMSVSRQSIRKLMLANGDFPLPVHEGSASVWHLADVLGWLDGRKGYAPDPVLREIAAATLEANLARNARRGVPATRRALERLIA